MTQISERIKIYTIFETSVLPEFSTNVLLLIDHADAGAAVGDYKVVTPFDYTDELTSTEDHYDWVQIFFSQKRVADKVYVCRYTGALEPALTLALAAVKEKTGDFWGICAVGATEEQILDLSSTVEASRQNMLFFVSNDVDIITSGTTDVASVLKGLGRDRTSIAFSPYVAKTSYLDSASFGAILPAQAGSVQFSWQELKGILPSSKAAGDITPITGTQRGLAEGKNCNHCEDVAGIKMLRMGTNCNRVPIHLILGADWMNASIQNSIFQYMLKEDSPSFSDETIGAIEGIVKAHLNAAVQRGLIVDSADEPIEYNFPTAATITSAVRATGKLTFNNCFKAKLAYPILDIEIYGSWSI